MMNHLDMYKRREIITCNTNLHVNSLHADRVMEEHDLVYIREGEWSIGQDGVRYNLVPGDVILLQAGHHHYGVEPCIGTVKTLFLHFSAAFADRLEDAAEDVGFCFPVVVHCRNLPVVEYYFREIISCYWSGERFFGVKCSAFLELLLAELSNAGEGGRTRDALADEILLLLNSHPNHYFSVKELSERYGFSGRSLSDKFKASTGEGILSYQRRRRCQMADELMKYHPELTLKEVAASFGFCDEYHFSKSYKTIFGHAPKSKSRKYAGS